MKRLYIPAVLLAMSSLGVNAQKIATANKIVDCGQVMFRSPVTAEFEITNKGGRATRIVDVRTSCGCTDVEYPTGDVPSDGKFTLRVKYDAKTMGHFDKFIDIYADNSNKPLVLRVRGNVVPEIVDFGGKYDFMLGNIQSDCNGIEFDDVNRGERPQKKIHIRNTTDETIQPVVMHLPDYLTAEVSPSKIAPQHSGVVTVTLDSNHLSTHTQQQRFVVALGINIHKFVVTSHCLCIVCNTHDKLAIGRNRSLRIFHIGATATHTNISDARWTIALVYYFKLGSCRRLIDSLSAVDNSIGCHYLLSTRSECHQEERCRYK